MKIYYNLEDLSCDTAVALGYFDGLHLGHQKVISKAVEYKKYGLTPVVFTFSENPKCILKHKDEKRIYSQAKKEREIENLGVEVLYIVDFPIIQNLSPQKFTEEILLKKLGAKLLTCGFNYHFGKGGKADANDLKNIAEKYSIKTEIIKPVLYEEEPISSTRIRNALKLNNINSAKNMLGI